MVAFAFARQWPERAATVTLIDAPTLDKPVFDQIRQDPRAWHFAFHSAPELPETLIVGSEAFCYGHFIHAMDVGTARGRVFGREPAANLPSPAPA